MQMEYRFPALLAGPTRKTARLALRQPPVEPARFRITTLAAPALLAMLASGQMESLALFVHNVRRTVRLAAPTYNWSSQRRRSYHSFSKQAKKSKQHFLSYLPFALSC